MRIESTHDDDDLNWPVTLLNAALVQSKFAVFSAKLFGRFRCSMYNQTRSPIRHKAAGKGAHRVAQLAETRIKNALPRYLICHGSRKCEYEKSPKVLPLSVWLSLHKLSSQVFPCTRAAPTVEPAAQRYRDLGTRM